MQWKEERGGRGGVYAMEGGERGEGRGRVTSRGTKLLFLPEAPAASPDTNVDMSTVGRRWAASEGATMLRMIPRVQDLVMFGVWGLGCGFGVWLEGLQRCVFQGGDGDGMRRDEL